MRCINQSQHAHRLAVSSRNLWFLPIDHWRRHDIGYDHPAEARRCHGYLGSWSFNGSSDWACRWRIPSSSKRMAVDILGHCYGCKLTSSTPWSLPLRRQSGHATDSNLGGCHYDLSIFLPSRIIPSNYPRAKGENVAKRDWQRKPQI